MSGAYPAFVSAAAQHLGRTFLMAAVALLALPAVAQMVLPQAPQMQRVQPAVPRAAVPTPSQIGTVAPKVSGVAPSLVMTGQNYTLQVVGQGLRAGMTISFGEGITLTAPLEVVSDRIARVQIQVAQTAAPGIRQVLLGVPSTGTLVAATALQPQEARLTVQGGQAPVQSLTATVPGATQGRGQGTIGLPPPPMMQPVPGMAPPPATQSNALQSVLPNQWQAGKTYQVMATGSGFTDAMEFRFGDGVTVKAPVNVLSPMLARFEVSVAANAKPGMRPAQVRATASQNWANTNASAWVLTGLVQATLQAKPKLPPLQLAFQPGDIYLRTPKWGDVKEGEFVTHHGTPLLDDDLVFTWDEQNPGSAEIFELRIYGPDNKTLLKTVRVGSNYYRPTPAFLGELLGTQALGGGGLAPTMKSVGQASVSSAAGAAFGGSKGALKATKTAGGGAVGKMVGKADYYWEVAGLHTYSKNGVVHVPGATPGDDKVVKKTETVEIEVEISERWPLGKPAAPTGLACPGSGYGTGVQVANISDSSVLDKNGLPIPGKVAVNNYVGDMFALTGSLSLAKSPYASHPKEVRDPSPGPGMFGNVAEHQFDNLFVDWGDDSGADPLNFPGSNSVYEYDRQTALTFPAANDFAKRVAHSYGQTGDFVVRVYQVGAADVKGAVPDALAGAVDGTGNSPYHLALGAGRAFAGGSSLQDVAKRAYMVFCKVVNVTNREDTDATGPLHLKSIEVAGFPGYGGMAAASAGAAKGKARSGAAAKSGAKAGGTDRPAVVNIDAKSQASVKTGVSMNAAAAAMGGQASGRVVVSRCDSSLTAEGSLSYYGLGRARFSWYRDGVMVRQIEDDVGPSSQRQGLARDRNSWPPIIEDERPTPNSGNLGEQQLGRHIVRVEAQVVPKPEPLQLRADLVGALRNDGRGGKGSGSPALAAVAKSGVKIGFLSPSKRATGGAPPVAYVSANKISGLVGDMITLPDSHVTSQGAPYEVVESDPSMPCKFTLPTQYGDFVIDGLQGKLAKQGTHYSGSGNLSLQLPLTDSGNETHVIPVTFANWDVPDGSTIAQGELHVAPAKAIEAPGVKGTLERIDAKAGKSSPLELTLSLTARDNTVRVPGKEEAPQEWKRVKAPLSAAGDWISPPLALPDSLIGWSAFRIQSNSVRLDLSRTDGAGASSKCGGAGGAGWVGVHLGSATVTPYTMDLVSTSSLQPKVGDWGMSSSGLCGHLDTGPFSTKLGEGSLSFDAITADAGGGAFSATYKGMKVHVPWLEIDLKGDAQLQSGGGKEAAISFPLTASVNPTKNYGPLTMKPKNPLFTREENVGWAVQTDTDFDFRTENKPFASDLPVSGLFFGMDGRAYFAKGKLTQDLALGGKAVLGKTPLDLVKLHMTAPSSGNGRLDFAFATQARLSEALPAADVQVNYAIRKDGDYTGNGPQTSQFQIQTAFPSAQPTVTAAIQPNYDQASGADTRFLGSVDLAMFGGPAIKGEFLLGYSGGTDYWATRISVPLGTGVALSPVPLTLYQVRGGLGYHMALTAFKDAGTLANAQKDTGVNLLFMAGMRLGTSDKFTYMMDGDFTVATGAKAGARMDYHAWLLKNQQTGNGDFIGYFQYAGGNFDGRLWGHLSFLNDAVFMDMGNSENNAAVDMHVGGGSWHVYAGKKEGPRIKAHFLVADADSYLMLSDSGLLIGGSQSIYLGVSAGGVASAYIKGYMDMGLGITPQPKVIGDFGAGAEAGACAFGACASMGVTAALHAEALPVDIRGTASVELPWPLPDVDVSVHL